MGANFLDGRPPDAMPPCKFRKLLAESGMSPEKIFDGVKGCLEKAGLKRQWHTIVGAATIAAAIALRGTRMESEPLK